MKQLLLSCLLCLLAVSICQARSASTYAPALAIDSDSDITALQAFACDTTQVKTQENVEKDEPQEKKKSLITRFLDYFNDANKKNDKRFDFSIIGGPHIFAKFFILVYKMFEYIHYDGMSDVRHRIPTTKVRFFLRKGANYIFFLTL